LLVVLHASGESPQAALEPVRELVKHWCWAVYGPCGSVRAGAAGKWAREPGYDWNAARDLDRVAAQVREWMTRLPLHSGAVYLAGHGSGANMAYLLGIRHPDLFTGVIAAGGRIQPELLAEAAIRRAATLLPIYSTHDPRDRTMTPAMVSESDEFLKTHRFSCRRDEGRRLPDDHDALREAVNWICGQRAALQKRLDEQTPEQVAAAMRQELPADMAIETAGRFVIASNAPEAARRRLASDFDTITRRCAALVGRGDQRDGPAIRVYYPRTQGEQASLHRSLTGTEIVGQHGCVSWGPTRAWGSADVGNGTLAHELVHVFVMSDWPAIPGWLNECLAVALGCPKVRCRT
jgi:predicted esterase